MNKRKQNIGARILDLKETLDGCLEYIEFKKLQGKDLSNGYKKTISLWEIELNELHLEKGLEETCEAINLHSDFFSSLAKSYPQTIVINIGEAKPDGSTPIVKVEYSDLHTNESPAKDTTYTKFRALEKKTVEHSKFLKYKDQLISSSIFGIEILENFLELVIENFPNSLHKIENNAKGRTRLLISKHRNSLFLNRCDLMEGFSKQLSNGWWLAKNYSIREINKFCSIIVASIISEYGTQNIKWRI